MGWLQAIQELWARWRAPLPLGRRGEKLAERYLRRQGYIIVARGQRDRLGEIDLVAVEGRTVVFVEVKTRRSPDVSDALAAVDEQKQRRLTRAALGYLRRHDLLEQPARFDVVAINWPEGQRRPDILHIQNAFPAIGNWQMFR